MDARQKYDEEKEESLVNIDGLIEGLLKGDNQMVFDNMGNDLEKPAIAISYEIKNIEDLLRKNGFDNVLMTGSGSCVYAIVPKDKKTENIEKKLKTLGYTVFVTKTLI